jgi:hypothetical protein
MKKLLVLSLAFFVISCSSQEKFRDKFKTSKPSVINGQVTKFEKNSDGLYTIHITTMEYGKVTIHYVPSTAWLLSIPVFVGKNGDLHYRKT